jgi:hypothetical protein
VNSRPRSCPSRSRELVAPVGTRRFVGCESRRVARVWPRRAARGYSDTGLERREAAEVAHAASAPSPRAGRRRSASSALSRSSRRASLRPSELRAALPERVRPSLGRARRAHAGRLARKRAPLGVAGPRRPPRGRRGRAARRRPGAPPPVARPALLRRKREQARWGGVCACCARRSQRACPRALSSETVWPSLAHGSRAPELDAPRTARPTACTCALRAMVLPPNPAARRRPRTEGLRAMTAPSPRPDAARLGASGRPRSCAALLLLGELEASQPRAAQLSGSTSWRATAGRVLRAAAARCAVHAAMPARHVSRAQDPDSRRQRGKS